MSRESPERWIRSPDTHLGLRGRLRIATAIIWWRVRYNVVVSETFSWASLIAARLTRLVSEPLAAALFMRAHRTTRKVGRQRTIERVLFGKRLLRPDVISRLLPAADGDQRYWSKRVIKLKEPRGEERGVIVISFAVFGQMAAMYDLAAILRDYYVVLEPSWAGYCTPEIVQFVNYPGARILVQAPDKLDFDFISRVGGNLVPISIGASNWVDHRVFQDLNLPKDYDCVMVAHFGPIKRHFVLFKALQKINDPTFRVCLIGEAAGGRDRADLEELARYYGVRDCLDIFEGIPPEEVNNLLNRSRVNVLLSIKEGANRAIFEGFFANVPGIVLSANQGVNKTYLNEHTGRLVDERDLAEALLWFRQSAATMKPRAWALKEISAPVSTKRLEAHLSRAASELGHPWRRPLVVKVNRPEFEYFDDALSPFEFEAYKKTDAPPDSRAGQHNAP